jgi:hypothetical protein
MLATRKQGIIVARLNSRSNFRAAIFMSRKSSLDYFTPPFRDFCLTMPVRTGLTLPGDIGDRVSLSAPNDIIGVMAWA